MVTTTIPQGRLLRRGLRVIGAQVALHPRPFVIAVAGATVYALATVGQSWVLGQVVDRVVTPRFESGRFQNGSLSERTATANARELKISVVNRRVCQWASPARKAVTISDAVRRSANASA